MRTIKVYEETVTPESLEQADSVCTDEIEIPVTVDELDIEEHETESAAYAAAAIKAIRDYGCVEPSSCPRFHAGIWYTTIDPETNYRTGDITHYSIRLDDFTEEEQRMIWQAIA